MIDSTHGGRGEKVSLASNSLPWQGRPERMTIGGFDGFRTLRFETADATTFLEGYFSTCHRSAKTRSAYKIDLAQLVAHLGPEMEIKAITSELLEKWATNLRSEEYRAVSIRRKFATARVFFAYWIRKGGLETSPLWKIRLDLGRERFLPRNLPPQDAKLLVEHAWKRVDLAHRAASAANDAAFLRLRNLAAVEILFATGIRVGELVSINIKDWSDGDAIFLAVPLSERVRLKKELQRLYKFRSKIAHGEHTTIPTTDLHLLEDLTKAFLIAMIQRRDEFTSKEALLAALEARRLA